MVPCGQDKTQETVSCQAAAFNKLEMELRSAGFDMLKTQDMEYWSSFCPVVMSLQDGATQAKYCTGPGAFAVSFTQFNGKDAHHDSQNAVAIFACFSGVVFFVAVLVKRRHAQSDYVAFQEPLMQA